MVGLTRNAKCEETERVNRRVDDEDCGRGSVESLI